MGRIPTAEPLARSGPTEWDAARSHRDQLLDSARSLVRATHHGSGAARCSEAACALGGTGDEELCAAAQRLAEVTDGPVAVRSVGAAIAAFRSDLMLAIDAVRACRQTAHPSGLCWFSSSPGADGCAELLRLAHGSS